MNFMEFGIAWWGYIMLWVMKDVWKERNVRPRYVVWENVRCVTTKCFRWSWKVKNFYSICSLKVWMNPTVLQLNESWTWSGQSIRHEITKTQNELLKLKLICKCFSISFQNVISFTGHYSFQWLIQKKPSLKPFNARFRQFHSISMKIFLKKPWEPFSPTVLQLYESWHMHLYKPKAFDMKQQHKIKYQDPISFPKAYRLVFKIWSHYILPSNNN